MPQFLPRAKPLQLVCNCLLQRVGSRSNEEMLALRQLMMLSATLRSRGQTIFVERELSVAQALAEVWPDASRQWELRMAAMTAIGAFRLAVDTWRESPQQSLYAITQQSFAQLLQLFGREPSPECIENS